MVKLSEKQVLGRARLRSLGAVKNLNCWASELTDVSIIQQMHNVEVINASANNIESLQPFLHCCNLRELYLRKNNIQQLNEILHLKNLSQLRLLWLSDNPCCDGVENTKYRSTVLKVLPNLQKLDNIAVTPEEVKQAIEEGETLNETEIKSEQTEPLSVVGNTDTNGDQKCEQLVSNSADTEIEEFNHSQRIPSEHEEAIQRVPPIPHHYQPENEEDSAFQMSMAETNKLRKELGLRPMPVRQYNSITPPTSKRHHHPRRNELSSTQTSTASNNILTASLALIQELDEEGLRTLQDAIQDQLQLTCRSDRIIVEESRTTVHNSRSPNQATISPKTSSSKSSVELT